jgi:hypothetical protein
MCVCEVLERMPVRSNEFQQLIHHIHSQMASKDALVTESTLLKERDSDAKREVDILIEDEVAGVKVRIAVECRDRSRPDTIEWIDNLVGKYQRLNVDKVVAVSRSGFTPETRNKASANNIETRTLEEALETDWPEEFAKLGVVKLTFRPILQEVYVETEPQLTGVVETSSTVTDGQGHVYGTLQEVVLDCFQQKIHVDAKEYVRRNFFEMFKTLEDLQGKAMQFKETVSGPDLYLIDAKGTRRKLLRLHFVVLVPFSTEESQVQRYLYEDKAQVTTSPVHFAESDTPFVIDIVQVADEDEGKVFFKPAKGSGK